MAPNCHQSCSQSCSQRQLDRSSIVTQVGAAAGLGDGVVYIQDGARLIFAGGVHCAASFMDIQQVGTKLWRKQRRDILITFMKHSAITLGGFLKADFYIFLDKISQNVLSFYYI